MSECKPCQLKKVAGTVLGLALLGTALFFSCGKADDAKKEDGKPDPAGDVEIHLTFDAYADDSVDKFHVYAGTSKDTLKKASDFTPASGSFDFKNPEITLESSGNATLTALLGAQACFQLKAVKDDVESEGSNVVCTDL